MPLQSEEVLAKLVEATLEAKTTIHELHEARGAAMDVLKKQKSFIADAIAAEVERQVGAVGDEARDRMRAAADEIILGIEREWRTVLHL